jgi:hypothetical protein
MKVKLEICSSVDLDESLRCTAVCSGILPAFADCDFQRPSSCASSYPSRGIPKYSNGTFFECSFLPPRLHLYFWEWKYTLLAPDDFMVLGFGFIAPLGSKKHGQKY